MNLEKYLTFDPIQLPEFGLNSYEHGFSIRFKEYKRLLFLKGIYIPNGPITKSKVDLDAFFDYLKQYKLTKVKIDLPLLIASDLNEYVSKKFISLGYKNGDYLQDNETILINKNNEKINNKEVRYYFRKASEKYEFKVIPSPSQKILDEVYELYKVSASLQGYEPKPKATFERMTANTYLGVGISKETGRIDGFVWAYAYHLARDLWCTSYLTMMDTVFIATNEVARKNYVGYGMHKVLFEYALNTLNVDYINFEGASRNQNRKYLAFKTSFGGEFKALGGSYHN